MPNRAKSFASAPLGGARAALVLLAATVLPGPNVTAFAAGECLESPNQRTMQPGHWYYHLDRAQNRRCWFFQPSEPQQPSETRLPDARSPEVRPPEVPAYYPPTAANPYAASEDSLLSRFAAGFSQGFAPPQQQQSVPPQNSIPEEPAGSTKIASPKSSGAGKVPRRPQAAPSLASSPAPTTSGNASAGQQDQTQPVSAGKDEKQPPLPLNVAERESLFQDFMKWQRERAVFGDRW
jgi:hypothetical protein